MLAQFCKTQGLEGVVKDCNSTCKTHAYVGNCIYRPADTLNIRKLKKIAHNKTKAMHHADIASPKKWDIF